MAGNSGQRELTPKQGAFVTEYLSNGFNATRAAIAAGYAEESAYSQGSRLLRHDEIAAKIETEFAKRGIRPTQCKILLGEVAFDTDITDFEPWLQGKVTLEELRASGVNTSLVKSSRISDKGARSIELHDRLGAVKEINRVLGLVTQKHEIAGQVAVDVDLSEMSNEELGRMAHAADADDVAGAAADAQDDSDQAASPLGDGSP